MKTIISYPRCGAHWLMSLVDTCLDKKVEWQHLHDIRFWNWWEMPHLVAGVDRLENGTLKPKFRASDLISDGFKPIIHHSTLQIARQQDQSHDLGEFIFLHREDLCSLAYSSLKHLQCDLTKESILRLVISHRTYMTEWRNFISNYDKPVLVVSYEDMVNDTKAALLNLVEFLGFDKTLVDKFNTSTVDKQKVYRDVHEASNKNRIMTESEFNNNGYRNMPVVRYDKKYIQQKESFIDTFGDYIDSLQGDLPEFDLLKSTRSIT